MNLNFILDKIDLKLLKVYILANGIYFVINIINLLINGTDDFYGAIILFLYIGIFLLFSQSFLKENNNYKQKLLLIITIWLTLQFPLNSWAASYFTETVTFFDYIKFPIYLSMIYFGIKFLKNKY